MVTWRRMAFPSSAGVPLSKTSKLMADGTARAAAVLILFEQAHNLGAALFVPGLGVADGFAVGKQQRIGQSVRADAASS